MKIIIKYIKIKLNNINNKRTYTQFFALHQNQKTANLIVKLIINI
jgi:hypothetical protein